MLKAKLSRRQFLKTTGFATAAALMGGMLKGDDFGWAFTEISLAQELQEIVPSACWIGKQDCGLWAWKVDGRVIKLEGHPQDPRTWGALCPKGQAQIASLYDPYRVKAPLKRTNAKGQPGRWVEISWDQAFHEIAAKLNEIRETDIRRFIWQVGRKKAAQWHHEAFNKAFGTKNKYGHGAVCSDAGYRAEELIFDQHGSAEVDFQHCEYFISWGWNITQAGGPHLCQITWPQQILEAKARGMKIVAVDPYIRGGAHLVDEWVPIKPGTDLAFWLAFAHVLVQKGYIDAEYLKTYTNAPVLVGPEGLLLTQNGQEMVWDAATGQLKPHKEAQDPALEGSFTIEGTSYKPAFQLYKEHIARYTPEWAAEICGISAETIRRIATEFGEKAHIGETIVLDGVEIPYRPVGIGFYHVTQQELGFSSAYAVFQATMLVGAVDVVGSTRPRPGKSTRPDVTRRAKWISLALHPEQIKDIPDGPSLGGTKYFPIDSGGYSITPLVLAEPEKWGLPFAPEEMVMWVQMANPVMSSMPQDIVIRGLSRLGLMVVVDPFLSETADFCADYVLPAATLDKYEGPLSGFTGYEKVELIRFPVVPPMFNSKPDPEIYLQMAERLGILDKYIEELNRQMTLSEELALDPSRMPTVEEALERWAQSKGKSLAWFQENGVLVKPMPVRERYARLWDPPYGGVKHAFYSEVLVRLGRTVQERGLTPEKFPFVQDYNAFPTWREPTMMRSPKEYDLTLISYKKILHKQSRTAHNVILNQMDSESFVEMSTETARAKGLRTGDQVWVESHNALTGETRRIKGRVKIVRGLRPGVVVIAYHHGQWAHPISRERDRGVSPNRLFPSGPGYVTLTGDQAFHVRVRVYKA